MKKVIVVLALVVSFAANAQDNEMAINLGLAMPLGDFAASGDFLKNGYTNPGFNLTIDGSYIPTWYFGIGGNISFSTFGLDENIVQADLIDLIESIPEIPGLDTLNQFNIGAWNYANFLLGPVLALPAGNFQFNFKALAGLSILMPPTTALDFSYNGEDYYTYTERQNVRLGMLLGADIIYKMSDSYSLKVGADYFRSKTNYELNIDIDESELTSKKSEVQVQAMHIKLGIAYLF